MSHIVTQNYTICNVEGVLYSWIGLNKSITIVQDIFDHISEKNLQAENLSRIGIKYLSYATHVVANQKCQTNTLWLFTVRLRKQVSQPSSVSLPLFPNQNRLSRFWVRLFSSEAFAIEKYQKDYCLKMVVAKNRILRLLVKDKLLIPPLPFDLAELKLCITTTITALNSDVLFIEDTLSLCMENTLMNRYTSCN